MRAVFSYPALSHVKSDRKRLPMSELVVKDGETQRAFVLRVLKEDGSISVEDVLFNTRREDGTRFSITRLASVIFDLRRRSMLPITERDSVYTLPRPAPVAAAWSPDSIVTVSAIAGTFLCPAAGCAQRLDLQHAKPSALDDHIVTVPCSTHGWQTVRIAA